MDRKPKPITHYLTPKQTKPITHHLTPKQTIRKSSLTDPLSFSFLLSGTVALRLNPLSFLPYDPLVMGSLMATQSLTRAEFQPTNGARVHLWQLRHV